MLWLLNKYKTLTNLFAFILLFLIQGTENILAQNKKLDIDSLKVKVYTYKIKGKTATGHQTWKVNHPFLAISRDLIEKFPLHSYVELSDCRWAGNYQVLDLMGKNHKKTIDIYYTKSKKVNSVECTCKAVN